MTSTRPISLAPSAGQQESDKPQGFLGDTPLSEFWALVADAEEQSSLLQGRLKAALDRCIGTEFCDTDGMLEFKRAFDFVARVSGVRPQMSDGTYASLQVRRKPGGKAYMALINNRKFESLNVPPNTLPRIPVSPIPQPRS